MVVFYNKHGSLALTLLTGRDLSRFYTKLKTSQRGSRMSTSSSGTFSHSQFPARCNLSVYMSVILLPLPVLLSFLSCACSFYVSASIKSIV